ncbi:hypothetical protein HWN40_03340 [Methanolobus zinderi]|uniref:Uncharacterized protein n=1 Tax=Methanolobus zinderi TaxID=536044 RepID=A0A7D5I405_9EURY|nr:hypothetical protein [Methanolobus zinderi]QLC49364.1 hypothetical protein HWN40_03340 [Methanolobus zinderi]
MVTAASTTISKRKRTTASYHNENAYENEREGFYSACGQAFIRVSPIKRD